MIGQTIHITKPSWTHIGRLLKSDMSYEILTESMNVNGDKHLIIQMIKPPTKKS